MDYFSFSCRVTTLVDRFVSEVKLERGESLTLETENLVVKAVDWDPDVAFAGEELNFPVRYRKKEKVSGRRRTVPFWDDDDTDEETVSKLYHFLYAILSKKHRQLVYSTTVLQHWILLIKCNII